MLLETCRWSSFTIPAQAITEANNKCSNSKQAGGKHGPYKKYCSTLQSEIGSMPVSKVQLQLQTYIEEAGGARRRV